MYISVFQVGVKVVEKLFFVVVRVHHGSTIIARQLRERPHVLSDDIAAHTQPTNTDCGTLSTIISGRYFRLTTPPTGRQPSTGVLTLGRSGTGWTCYCILWRQHPSPTPRHLAHFSRERLTPFVLRQQPLQRQWLSTDRFLHLLASITWP